MTRSEKSRRYARARRRSSSSSDSCEIRRKNAISSTTTLLSKHFTKEQEMVEIREMNLLISMNPVASYCLFFGCNNPENLLMKSDVLDVFAVERSGIEAMIVVMYDSEKGELSEENTWKKRQKCVGMRRKEVDDSVTDLAGHTWANVNGGLFCYFTVLIESSDEVKRMKKFHDIQIMRNLEAEKFCHVGKDIPLMMYDRITDSEAAYSFKMRPIGIRWRDEATLARIAYNYTQRMEMREITIMPLMTERQRTHPVHISGQLLPTTSTSFSAQNHDDPSLEDIELIDVLWRSDIAAEKGARHVEPAEQYERDLQLLTEKSLYSDLSKVYFEDFCVAPHLFRSGVKGYPQTALRSESFQLEDGPVEKRQEDLAELLADVSKEDGELNRLACSDPHSCAYDFDTLPVQFRALQFWMSKTIFGQIFFYGFKLGRSAAEATRNISVVWSEGNIGESTVRTWLRKFRSGDFDLEVSEMSLMQQQQQIAIDAVLSPSAPTTLYNETSAPSFWMQQAEVAPSDIYPNNGFMTFQNDTEEQVISTGSQYDHQYYVGPYREHRDENPADLLQPIFDPYYSARTASFSRYFGKLAPRGVDEVVAHPSTCGFNNDSIVDDLCSVAAVPRKRGRQSKDEQLAAANRLPLSAREISEMTLGELHKVLKNLNLTEHQKQLIRKIRRRGKNKLAARTCRERRGERHRCLNEAETQWKELCILAMYYFLDIYEFYVMGDDTALRCVAKRVTV
ncbi:unnamed protein product [Angiostrongylus costaricensis]|uniref:BZIP domain-containing protein n=1 Tax=Angiostrongylus costaricensis TaxID=334426 RepID=A0A0R3PXC6_ANGCS|nr:unnamed protein product [Angiostrongylus costaricensis]